MAGRSTPKAEDKGLKSAAASARKGLEVGQIADKDVFAAIDPSGAVTEVGSEPIEGAHGRNIVKKGDYVTGSALALLDRLADGE